MKILAVDNNPIVLRILTTFLNELGHETRTAADGLAALPLLEQFLPDVVITDLAMPNISGDKLCRIIRELPGLGNCFIIILSTVPAESNPAASEADVCITKGKVADIKEHLKSVLAWAGQSKSDTLFDIDLTAEAEPPAENVAGPEADADHSEAAGHFPVILEYVGAGIIGLDPDGRIIYANRAAAGLVRQPREELLGRDFTALFTDTDRAAVQRGLQMVKQSTGSEPIQIDSDPFLNLNGSIVILQALPFQLGEKRGSVMMIQDQSAKVIGAKTVSVVEARWRTLFKEMPGGALLLEDDDSSSFTVVAANRAAVRMLNLDPQRITGQVAPELWPEADRAEIAGLLQQVQQSRRKADLATSAGSCRCCPLPSGELLVLLY